MISSMPQRTAISPSWAEQSLGEPVTETSMKPFSTMRADASARVAAHTMLITTIASGAANSRLGTKWRRYSLNTAAASCSGA